MKLIIINGPTGVGKSTLAARLHEEMPSSVLLDIDELRRTIPNYRERGEESLRLAYDMAAGAIGNAHQAGKDVIVDKTIGDESIFERFMEAAREHGAEAYEFLLFGSKDSVQARADARGYRPGSLLTPEKVGMHWERANELKDKRPNAMVIDTSNLSSEEVFKTVSAKVLG